MYHKNNSPSIRQHYESLLGKVTERKHPVQELVDMLHTETTWLTSPASTKYHLNNEGGLLQHSVGVAETLLRIKATLAPKISDESCVIAGLFHDVAKSVCRANRKGYPWMKPLQR